MLSKQPPTTADDGQVRVETLSPRYSSRELCSPVPKYHLPTGQMPADVAYQIVHDELNLDGNSALNLATFVTTWMEPQALALMTETVGKNAVDQDEYPQTTEIQNRCVNMIARLFHAPGDRTSVGTATIGSSEAIHLAGLALKWRWRQRRAAAGQPSDRPNIVMGHNVQVCWEKFARYFDVEPRYVALTPERFVLGVDEACSLVDENTIGVVGVLGSTYTGEYEPIAELNAALVDLNERRGFDVPIHVDAASGGFVAPFLDPDLLWDFRLPLVRSINTSGHKYGLVYPGLGWVIWRTEADLPDDLIFHVNYLGGDQPTFNLNFSKSAGPVIAQYYNLLRLGYDGYRQIMRGLQETAIHLADAVGQMDAFSLVGMLPSLPLVCFRLEGERPYTVFDLSNKLRERGWIVPAYTLAPDAEDIAVLRVVVREGVSRDMIDSLIADLGRAVDHFDSRAPGDATATPTGTKTKGIC